MMIAAKMNHRIILNAVVLKAVEVGIEHGTDEYG